MKMRLRVQHLAEAWTCIFPVNVNHKVLPDEIPENIAGYLTLEFAPCKSASAWGSIGAARSQTVAVLRTWSFS